MAAVMVIAMLTALTGCAGKENTQTRKKNKVVEIPMILEFLKFRTKLNKEQKEELLNSRTRQEGTLLDDYLKAYTGNPQIVPNYQVKWNSLLQEDVLGECLAELVQGKITEQEFTQAEDESIRQFEEEQ